MLIVVESVPARQVESAQPEVISRHYSVQYLTERIVSALLGHCNPKQNVSQSPRTFTLGKLETICFVDQPRGYTPIADTVSNHGERHAIRQSGLVA